MSATHASIRARGAGYDLFDEGSTNGTRVNEVRLVEGRPKPLQSNDIVDLGGYRLEIEVGVPVAQTMSARLTADFARQMLSEQLGPRPDSEVDAELSAIMVAQDERVELLPIHKEQPSAPPPPRESRPSRPRSSRPETEAAPAEPIKLQRSEVAVYALAALVVATSVVAMALLMRS